MFEHDEEQIIDELNKTIPATKNNIEEIFKMPRNAMVKMKLKTLECAEMIPLDCRDAVDRRGK